METSQRKQTYPRKLRNDHRHQSQQVDEEVCQIVVGIVSAQQEQGHGDAEQELLCRRVLVSVVDLLPHVEIVVCPGIELKGDSSYVMEHQVGAKHVADVGEGPGNLLRNPGDDVEEDLEPYYQDKVNSPGS